MSMSETEWNLVKAIALWSFRGEGALAHERQQLLQAVESERATDVPDGERMTPGEEHRMWVEFKLKYNLANKPLREQFTLIRRMTEAHHGIGAKDE